MGWAIKSLILDHLLQLTDASIRTLHVQRSKHTRVQCIRGKHGEVNVIQALTVSVRLAKPFVGCCVRMSYTVNLDSRPATTSLFMGMSLRSNSMLHICEHNYIQYTVTESVEPLKDTSL